MKAVISKTSVWAMTRDTACHAVLECTHRLVESALQSDWIQVLDGMEHRRKLLDEATLSMRADSPTLVAMHAAINESERAMAKVVAHAIVSARMQGTASSLCH